MSRSTTPAYRVEFSGGSHYVTPACWRGRATAGRLADYMAAHEASLAPGGANEHLATVGYRPSTVAKLVRQSDGVTVATWRKAGASSAVFAWATR